MFKVVKSNEGVIRKISANKTVNNLITKDISPNISLATTEATDYYSEEIAKYNRIYYVLEGELKLVFNDEEVKLQASDSCFISQNTEYIMSGSFKLIIVNQPAFGSSV